MLARLIKSSKYITFACLIVFVGCEACLRIFYAEHMIVHHFPLVYAPDSSQGFKGIARKEGYIRRPSIEKKFRLNNAGFYGPDIIPQHPDSIFRILVCGSSVVEGIWANQRTSYPAMLNELFKAQGFRVEVINCGISGSNRDWQNMNVIRDVSSRFHANMVLFEHPIPIHWGNYLRGTYKDYAILFTGDSSAEWNQSEAIARRKVDLLKANSLLTGMYDLCYCIRYWARSAADSWNTPTQCWKDYADNGADSWQYYIPRDLDVRQSIYALNDLQKELNRKGCQLIAYEYGNSDMSDRIRESDEVMFPYISLSLPLDDKKYQHELDDHLNYLGFTITAEKLFNELRQRYIPAAFCPGK